MFLSAYAASVAPCTATCFVLAKDLRGVAKNADCHDLGAMRGMEGTMIRHMVGIVVLESMFVVHVALSCTVFLPSVLVLVLAAACLM